MQYAAPGTQLKSYCDGVYVADSALGKYKLQPHNPMSYKPEGFIAGAGHSGTFKDKYGNYWHITTMTISKKHIFERRLGLFPVAFDKDSLMYSYTGFGDYPYSYLNKKTDNINSILKGWMLLSYNKPVTVSSTLDTVKTKPSYAVNEDIRTWWSAATGNKGEFLSVDLLNKSTIHAIQLNFEDVDTKTLGRPSDNIGYQYLIEASENGEQWHAIIDKSISTEDLTHPYFELPKPIKARYIRVTNIAIPSGKFAISGLRVFGFSNSSKPTPVQDFEVKRTFTDTRVVQLKWNKQPNVTGYNIRYGISKNKLYQNYIVYDSDNITIRSLLRDSQYWFTIDAFNENGITESKMIKLVL